MAVLACYSVSMEVIGMFGFEIIAAIAIAPLVWALIPHKTHITYIAPEVGDFNTWKYTRGHVVLKETK